jgi:nucleotide-binding universal stress UspA family protein
MAETYIGKTREELQDIVEKDRMESFKLFLENYGADQAANVKTELIENKLGDIGTYIMDFAQDNEADMIVIGAKGHSRVERLLLGSVTERLLSENETIPTLVVK